MTLFCPESKLYKGYLSYGDKTANQYAAFVQAPAGVSFMLLSCSQSNMRISQSNWKAYQGFRPKPVGKAAVPPVRAPILSLQGMQQMSEAALPIGADSFQRLRLLKATSWIGSTLSDAISCNLD